MKIIMFAGITYHPYEDRYTINAESNEAEYGEEWDGDVLGYAENALDADGYTVSKELPSGIQLDTGHAYGSDFVYILDEDGSPVEVYWLAD